VPEDERLAFPVRRDGLGGVREAQPGGHGGDLEGAPLVLAVTALAGVGCGRDVAPGQGRELAAQLRLVVLHGQDVVRAALIHQVALTRPSRGPCAP
jgi:hypothetical protein